MLGIEKYSVSTLGFNIKQKRRKHVNKTGKG